MLLRFGPVVENWATVYGMFSKCTCQALSGHDDVIQDFHYHLKPSQSSQEDKRLPETQVLSVVAAFLWLHSSRSSSSLTNTWLLTTKCIDAATTCPVVASFVKCCQFQTFILLPPEHLGGYC